MTTTVVPYLEIQQVIQLVINEHEAQYGVTIDPSTLVYTLIPPRQDYDVGLELTSKSVTDKLAIRVYISFTTDYYLIIDPFTVEKIENKVEIASPVNNRYVSLAKLPRSQFPILSNSDETTPIESPPTPTTPSTSGTGINSVRMFDANGPDGDLTAAYIQASPGTPVIQMTMPFDPSPPYVILIDPTNGGETQNRTFFRVNYNGTTGPVTYPGDITTAPDFGLITRVHTAGNFQIGTVGNGHFAVTDLEPYGLNPSEQPYDEYKDLGAPGSQVIDFEINIVTAENDNSSVSVGDTGMVVFSTDNFVTYQSINFIAIPAVLGSDPQITPANLVVVNTTVGMSYPTIVFNFQVVPNTLTGISYSAQYRSVNQTLWLTAINTVTPNTDNIWTTGYPEDIGTVGAYVFRVIATDAEGNVLSSNIATLAAPLPPLAVTTLSASQPSTNVAAVTFSEPAGQLPGTTYRVGYAIHGSSTITFATSNATPGSPWTFAGGGYGDTANIAIPGDFDFYVESIGALGGTAVSAPVQIPSQIASITSVIVTAFQGFDNNGNQTQSTGAALSYVTNANPTTIQTTPLPATITFNNNESVDSYLLESEALAVVQGYAYPATISFEVNYIALPGGNAYSGLNGILVGSQNGDLSFENVYRNDSTTNFGPHTLNFTIQTGPNFNGSLTKDYIVLTVDPTDVYNRTFNNPAAKIDITLGLNAVSGGIQTNHGTFEDPYPITVGAPRLDAEMVSTTYDIGNSGQQDQGWWGLLTVTDGTYPILIEAGGTPNASDRVPYVYMYIFPGDGNYESDTPIFAGAVPGAFPNVQAFLQLAPGTYYIFVWDFSRQLTTGSMSVQAISAAPVSNGPVISSASLYYVNNSTSGTVEFGDGSTQPLPYTLANNDKPIYLTIPNQGEDLIRVFLQLNEPSTIFPFQSTQQQQFTFGVASLGTGYLTSNNQVYFGSGNGQIIQVNYAQPNVVGLSGSATLYPLDSTGQYFGPAFVLNFTDTLANYLLNPNDEFNTSLGPNELTAYISGNTTESGAIRSVRGNGSGSGKRYFEVHIDNTFVNTGDYPTIGVATANATLGGELTDGNGYQYSKNGYYITPSGNINGGVPYAQNDTIMVAVDFTTNNLWFGKNGVWNGGGDPGAGTLPTFPTISLSGNLYAYLGNTYNGDAAQTTQSTINLGSTSFAYTLPNGFEAWGNPIT